MRQRLGCYPAVRRENRINRRDSTHRLNHLSAKGAREVGITRPTEKMSTLHSYTGSIQAGFFRKSWQVGIPKGDPSTSTLRLPSNKPQVLPNKDQKIPIEGARGGCWYPPSEIGDPLSLSPVSLVWSGIYMVRTQARPEIPDQTKETSLPLTTETIICVDSY